MVVTEFFRVRLDGNQALWINGFRLMTGKGKGRRLVKLQAQRYLATGHGQINLGQQFGIQQRAVQITA